jgi:Phospholipid-translocating P-type ATPase C-terminal
MSDEILLQSFIVFFIILYGYFSPSARKDGFDVARVEFGTTMAISAAIASNLFNGLTIRFWTAWVFFAVFIGIILIFVYTVSPTCSMGVVVTVLTHTFLGHLFYHLPRLDFHTNLW